MKKPRSTDEGKLLSLSRAVEWHVPSNPGWTGKLLLFSACDLAYLKYAISLIRSLDIFSPGFTFVLHVVNPTEKSLKRLGRLSSKLAHTRLLISIERINLATLDDEARRTYYASARFVRLAELLPEIETPILYLDSDSLVVNPIDYDFTVERDAEICLVRRDLQGTVEDHLAVATGVIWIKSTNASRCLINAVAKDIAGELAKGNARWFLDQVAFKRQLSQISRETPVYNIKRKYADWSFHQDSIVWSGKGERKNLDLRYVLLQRLLTDDLAARYRLLSMIAELGENGKVFPLAFKEKLRKAAGGLRPHVALFLPRMDLPWKALTDPEQAPPQVPPDTLALRLHWKEFGARLANAMEQAGVKVDAREAPAWEINRKAVERESVELALVPHRCRHDFADGETPVLFYMQEYFRWIFVVDEAGWSASSTQYPVTPDRLAGAPTGAFDDYRCRLEKGELDSKFAQAKKVTLSELRENGQLPDTFYIFFPLQIPHDQSILYFSDVEEIQVVKALLDWSTRRGVPVVMKPHPVSPKSMAPFEALARDYGAYWSDANIDDLISHAAGVYTINSGVGFESLLRLRPVVTFGRVEYDCVSFRARLDNLDEAWRYCQSADATDLEERYRCFFDWFIDGYAVDLSRPESAARRLEAIVRIIRQKVFGARSAQ